MNETNHLNRLDHIRFFAAAMVIIYHFRGKHYDTTGSLFKSLLATWINNGATGVSLFLVMSGFLFCIISKEGSREIDYFKFLKNRILRIFPLLTVVVFALICVTRSTSSPEDIFRLLTLQLNTGPLTDKIFPIGPIWTIAVEFQFYLIFPFLAIFLHKHGVRQIILIISAVLLVKLGIVTIKGDGQYGNLYNTITGRLDQLLIGMLFGCVYNRFDSLDKLKSKTARILLFASSLLLLTIYFHLDKTVMFRSVIGFSIEAMLWGGFIISYLKLPFYFNGIIDRALVSLGSVSFSMYLLHMPIGEALKASGIIHKSGLTFIESTLLIILPVVIAVSYVTYNAIEKPFLSMKVKYLK